MHACTHVLLSLRCIFLTDDERREKSCMHGGKGGSFILPIPDGECFCFSVAHVFIIGLEGRDEKRRNRL